LFIPLLNLYSGRFGPSNSLKYFLIQGLCSSVIIFVFFIKIIFIDLGWVIVFILIIKLGLAPFHYWFIRIVKYISWEIVFLLSVLQKILPLYFLYVFGRSYLLVGFRILSIIRSVLGCYNQIFLTKLVGYSSLNSMGWVIINIVVRNSFYIFFICYRGLVLCVCLLFIRKKFYLIDQLVNTKVRVSFKILLLVLFLRIGGFPPLVGFFIKVFVIIFIIKFLGVGITVFLVTRSLMIIYIYMRIFIIRISLGGAKSVRTYLSVFIIEDRYIFVWIIYIGLSLWVCLY
jgi:NADH:ubiquinone oxidoreductase subunit 2 (subunit N)